jgi:hypothetical protein
MLIVIYDPTNCPILPVLADGYQRHLAFVAPLGIVVAKSTRGPRTAERRATRPKCGQFSRGHTVPALTKLSVVTRAREAAPIPARSDADRPAPAGTAALRLLADVDISF